MQVGRKPVFLPFVEYFQLESGPRQRIERGMAARAEDAHGSVEAFDPLKTLHVQRHDAANLLTPIVIEEHDREQAEGAQIDVARDNATLGGPDVARRNEVELAHDTFALPRSPHPPRGRGVPSPGQKTPLLATAVRIISALCSLRSRSSAACSSSVVRYGLPPQKRIGISAANGAAA